MLTAKTGQPDPVPVDGGDGGKPHVDPIGAPPPKPNPEPTP